LDGGSLRCDAQLASQNTPKITAANGRKAINIQNQSGMAQGRIGHWEA
jgi:hypothetical protein